MRRKMSLQAMIIEMDNDASLYDPTDEHQKTYYEFITRIIDSNLETDLNELNRITDHAINHLEESQEQAKEDEKKDPDLLDLEIHMLEIKLYYKVHDIIKLAISDLLLAKSIAAVNILKNPNNSSNLGKKVQESWFQHLPKWFREKAIKANPPLQQKPSLKKISRTNSYPFIGKIGVKKQFFSDKSEAENFENKM